jgi:PII-like signaling protein
MMNLTMKHYFGFGLHSNNPVVVIIDDKDERVFAALLKNKLLTGTGLSMVYRMKISR